MIPILSLSNNNIYNNKVYYKDKTCAGSKCDNTDTHLYQMSLAIGYSFLCNNCKRSVEKIGYILNIKTDTDNVVAQKENFKGQSKTINDRAKRQKRSSNSRSSSITLQELQ